jgi:DNA-binding response OmpR family regulator
LLSSDNEGVSSVGFTPKILIVDDSVTLCLIITRMLQKAGYQVLTASNGREGLNKAMQERPQCVILDVVLPGISGFSLCRQLRALDPQHALSIIMISTKNTPMDQSWGLRQGADHYLPKPFTEQQLLDVLRDVLTTHARR